MISFRLELHDELDADATEGDDGEEGYAHLAPHPQDRARLNGSAAQYR